MIPTTMLSILLFTDVLAGNHSNGLASDLMSRKADSIPLTATERSDYPWMVIMETEALAPQKTVERRLA